MLEVVAIAQRVIEDRLAPVLDAIARGQRTDADDPELERQLREAMDRVRLKLHEALPSPLRTAERMSKEVEAQQRRLMNQQWRSIAPIDLFSPTEAVAPELRKAVRRNVALIESIPAQLHSQVEAVVGGGIARGSRVETIRDQLQERFGVARSRAELIARDQVGKLSGALAQTRQEELGVDEYEWSCAGDERVRGKPGGKYADSKSDHWKLNGTVQKWSEPPVVDESTGRRAHPGEDYQCRCQALPRVASLLDKLGIPDEDEDLTPAEPTPPRKLTAVAKMRSHAAEPLTAALAEQERRPLLSGARIAAAGVTDEEIDYIRAGMRDLSQHRSAYAGLSQREINEVATGLRPSSRGQVFEPIKLESDLHPAISSQGRKLALIDGRHRYVAASEAGAEYIAAEVDGERVLLKLEKGSRIDVLAASVRAEADRAIKLDSARTDALGDYAEATRAARAVLKAQLRGLRAGLELEIRAAQALGDAGFDALLAARDRFSSQVSVLKNAFRQQHVLYPQQDPEANERQRAARLANPKYELQQALAGADRDTVERAREKLREARRRVGQSRARRTGLADAPVDPSRPGGVPIKLKAEYRQWSPERRAELEQQIAEYKAKLETYRGEITSARQAEKKRQQKIRRRIKQKA